MRCRAARNRGDYYAVIISFGREGDTYSVKSAPGSLNILEVIANRDHLIPGPEAKADDTAPVVISEPELAVRQENDSKISISGTPSPRTTRQPGKLRRRTAAASPPH